MIHNLLLIFRNFLDKTDCGNADFLCIFAPQIKCVLIDNRLG